MRTNSPTTAGVGKMKPVAGVAVTFFLADHGASGVFANGSQSMTVLTDANGQAAMRGMVPNQMAGKMEIRVSARLGNLNADAVITQTNASKTLPVALNDFIGRYGGDFGRLATGGVIAAIPPVIIAFVFQRYIVAGLTAGSVKG